MEDSKITYYEHSHNLIDNGVIDRTRRFWPHGTVIFYAQRRHYLEIIPEFIVSLLVSASVVAFAVWLRPWEWFTNPYTHANPGLPAFLLALSIILPWGYFVLEVLRWSMEFLVLTNRGLYNPNFDVWSLDFQCPRVDWITSSSAQIPLSYKVSGIDVGTLIYKEPGGTRKKTPAVSYPHRLHGLIPVAEEYKATAKHSEVGWRN